MSDGGPARPSPPEGGTPAKRDAAEKLLSKFSGVRLLVLGDVMLGEYLWGTTERLSPEAPVPVVAVEQRTFAPGGAANAAANAQGLGAQVSLAGVIGDDESGKDLCSTLTAQGIDVEGLLVDAGRPTTTKTRLIASSISSASIRKVAPPCRTRWKKG
jgi:rfaE bifunctional protein kinase chain/domain